MKLKASCLGMEGRECVSCICPLPAVSFLSCSVTVESAAVHFPSAALLVLRLRGPPSALLRWSWAVVRFLCSGKEEAEWAEDACAGFSVFGFPVKLPYSSGVGRDSIPE